MVHDELILEILSRLPVKTLCRFRCVSKPWHSLILDPFFRSLHHERSQKKIALRLNSWKCRCLETEKYAHHHHLYTYNEVDKCLLNEEFVFVEAHLSPSKLLPSGGGSLLCCVSEYDILVCNPSTHELLTLPRGTQYFYPHNIQIPREQPLAYSHICMVGFAYLHVENEYKVVRLFYKNGDESTYFDGYEVRCEILTLRDGGGSSSWRLVDELCPYPVYSSFPRLVNQALHWLINDDYWCTHMQDHDTIDERIVALNLKTEEFKVINAPPGIPNDDHRTMKLTELRGFLVLALEFPGSKLDIWFLKDYDKTSWVKEYVIDLKRMDHFDSDYETEYVVPYHIRDGELVIDWNGKRLDHYTIETQSFKNLVREDNWMTGKLKCKCSLELEFYQDSFFSLGANGSKIDSH